MFVREMEPGVVGLPFEWLDGTRFLPDIPVTFVKCLTSAKNLK